MESTFAITATAPAKDYQFQNIRPGYILGGNIRFPNFSLRAFWGSEDFSLPMGAPNMRNWGYFVNIGASQMALLGMWGVFVTNSGSRLALLRRWEFVVINEGVPTVLLEEVRIFVTNGGPVTPNWPFWFWQRCFLIVVCRGNCELTSQSWFVQKKFCSGKMFKN